MRKNINKNINKNKTAKFSVYSQVAIKTLDAKSFDNGKTFEVQTTHHRTKLENLESEAKEILASEFVKIVFAQNLDTGEQFYF